MAEKPGHVITVAAVTGIITAIVSVVLLAVVLANLWWSLEQSFGHAMFHKLGDIVTGAEYMQGFSLLVALSMTAGAITVYFSREVVSSEREACVAGTLAGLNIAGAFFLCALIQFILMSGNIPFTLKYAIENVPGMILLWMIGIGIITVPSSIAGAIVLWRNIGNQSQTKKSRGATVMIAGLASILVAYLITAAIALYYGTQAIYPLFYAIPLLLMVTLVAAWMYVPNKKGTIPVVIVIMTLSIVAIVVLPLAGTWLACQTGAIYAEPYDWENPPMPDVYIWTASNTSYPLIDLARNYSIHTNFDWGASLISGGGEDADLRVIEHINASLCDLGVIGRPLTPDEAALGINQTFIGNNSAIGQVVFIIKGPVSTNLTQFLNYALSPEGQEIFNRSTTVPY